MYYYIYFYSIISSSNTNVLGNVAKSVIKNAIKV